METQELGSRLEAVERQTDKCARCWLEKSTRVEREGQRVEEKAGLEV